MPSLSVSFQGESFFYKPSRAPRASSPSSPAARRGPTPERQKSVSSVPESESTRPQHRWPAAKPKASDPLTRSLDCSLDRKDSILVAVHLLRRRRRRSPPDPATVGTCKDSDLGGNEQGSYSCNKLFNCSSLSLVCTLPNLTMKKILKLYVMLFCATTLLTRL